MLISFLLLVLTDFTSDIQQEIDEIKCSPLRRREISKHMVLGKTSQIIIITTENAKAQRQKLIRETSNRFLGFHRYQRFYFSSIPITRIGFLVVWSRCDASRNSRMNLFWGCQAAAWLSTISLLLLAFLVNVSHTLSFPILHGQSSSRGALLCPSYLIQGSGLSRLLCGT